MTDAFGRGPYYTWEEIRAHATMADAWVVISGEVFDITHCFALHKHSEAFVSKFLGTDITELFMRIHSPRTRTLVIERRVGTLRP